MPIAALLRGRLPGPLGDAYPVDDRHPLEVGAGLMAIRL
jgi:hypothetical protein